MDNESSSSGRGSRSSTSADSPETPEESPTLYHGGRKEVDDAFVQSLLNYAANDTECSPLFKAYLEDVILRPDFQDLRLKVEYHLRNLRIKDYNLGPTFLRELQRYTIFEQLYLRTSWGKELPSAPIPEQYQPQTQFTPGQADDINSAMYSLENTELRLGEAAEHESEDDSEDEGEDEGEFENQQMRTSVIDRLRATQEHTPPPRASAAPATSGRQPKQSLPRAGNSGGRDETMDRTGPDWEVSSWYKGRRQPPLAARLDTIINFLADEDMDRCRNWETKFAEVVAYLEWLKGKDDMHQLENASPQTQAMYDDAATKAEAHRLFEQHHYNPTPLEFSKPRKTPLRSTRLNWLITEQHWPLPCRTTVPNRDRLLPKSIPPRPPSPVNRMLIDKPGDRSIYEEFAHEEKDWWQEAAAEANTEEPPITADENLACIDDASFNIFTLEPKTDWIQTDPTTGHTTIPLLAETELPPGYAPAWATERGARRAILQRALRALPTNPSRSRTGAAADAPHRQRRRRNRLILPLPPSTLREVRARADGPHWTAPRLDPRTQLPQGDELETLPTVVSYRERLARIKQVREAARLRVEEEEEGAEERLDCWVPLPRNIANGGPFVWRMLDGGTQARQDLLARCRVLVRVLEAACEKVPRPLLEGVLKMVPAGEWLAEDEREQGETAVLRLLDDEEVNWLRFLAGECVNSRNWTGRFVPDTPKDKYRLFLLFASKVQKLLDDKNPEGLFSRHDAVVEVEQLLEAVNAGRDSSAVTKHEFQPHDACAWLNRMNETGHVRFHLRVDCYGIVQRPVAEYFPEHRVRWPDALDNRKVPSYSIGDISDWSSIIRDGRVPDVSKGSNIWNFFLSLAFRLGYTISILSREQVAQAHGTQPISTRNLRESINKWKQACSRLQATVTEPTPEELALIRTSLITELAANKTMLAPGRVHYYSDRNGNPLTMRVRDHNWDWASPTVLGRPQRHQFWSVNRWPLGRGYLSETAERAVREDKHLNPAMTYDPAAADPTTDARYLQPKPPPFREEKVVFHAGPAAYTWGDTRLQRKMVREYVLDMAERALGLDEEEPRTWTSKALARLNPFSRPPSRIEGGQLPAVNLKGAPQSRDPLGHPARWDEARRNADAMNLGEGEWEDEDDYEVESVDVAMTGMGESWGRV